MGWQENDVQQLRRQRRTTSKLKTVLGRVYRDIERRLAEQPKSTLFNLEIFWKHFFDRDSVDDLEEWIDASRYQASTGCESRRGLDAWPLTNPRNLLFRALSFSQCRT